MLKGLLCGLRAGVKLLPLPHEKLDFGGSITGGGLGGANGGLRLGVGCSGLVHEHGRQSTEAGHHGVVIQPFLGVEGRRAGLLQHSLVVFPLRAGGLKVGGDLFLSAGGLPGLDGVCLEQLLGIGEAFLVDRTQGRRRCYAGRFRRGGRFHGDDTGRGLP